MLLKLGTITAKFHQGPHALINLLLQISAVRGAGETGGGKSVINNVGDQCVGRRARGPVPVSHCCTHAVCSTHRLQQLRRLSTVVLLLTPLTPGCSY